MVINLKDKEKVIPRNDKGDPAFQMLRIDEADRSMNKDLVAVLDVFQPAEVVELVNRALYQIEYQKASHRKRGQEVRDRDKAIKAALKAQGVDVKGQEVKDQLEGKK